VKALNSSPSSKKKKKYIVCVCVYIYIYIYIYIYTHTHTHMPVGLSLNVIDLISLSPAYFQFPVVLHQPPSWPHQTKWKGGMTSVCSALF
jgi:hypothetical protein